MSEIQAYAKRIMPPFSAVLQVVEDDKARAISMDGKVWEIQAWHETSDSLFMQNVITPTVKKHFRVAAYTLENGLYRYPLYPTLNPEEIYAACTPIIDHIATLELPLRIRDNFEYWLVDENDKKPLALICSSHSKGDFQNIPSIPHWKALSSMQINLRSTEEEIREGLSPPSDRLEKLVRRKAGLNPKAYWFERDAKGDGLQFLNGETSNQVIDCKDFPEFLLSEDWESDEDISVCRRYLERTSPRLLMLQRLSSEARKRAEIMANAFALEVERYYKLYPEVADEGRMVAIRVEARLRSSICKQTAD